jgi:hypothetical protein
MDFSIDSLHLNFFRVILIWLLFWGFIGGAVISALSPGISYLDGFFQAISALTGTGICSVEIRALSTGSLIVIYILMYFGGSCILLLPPMLYRRVRYSHLKPELDRFMKEEGASGRPLANAVVEVIKNRDMVHRAIGTAMIAVILHNLFWIVIGSFIMYGIAQHYDDPAECVERGFSKLWTSAFLAASRQKPFSPPSAHASEDPDPPFPVTSTADTPSPPTT